MLSLFRRKRPAEPTFNERVTAFWRWFQEIGPRFYATIEAGKCAALGDETSAKVDELLPGFCWVYGAGKDGNGHSFTLTGEGDIHRQLLALRWLACAPVIEGWTFYAARQAGPIRGQVIETGGRRFAPKEIWVTPVVNTEEENIDLTIWHPAWEEIEPKQRGFVTFLFLDEALGEYGTEWWVGQIDYSNQRLAGAFPLEELADFVNATARARGWKKHPPGEIWSLYRTKESKGDFPRADILTQNTCVPKLFTSFMSASGDLPDPTGGTGADYVYVSIEAAFFPKGKEVERRSEIAEAIGASLDRSGGGKVVGGAFGSERSYCDFLIFDGARSLAAIADVLRGMNVPKGTMIEYFAREKRGQRIAL